MYIYSSEFNIAFDSNNLPIASCIQLHEKFYVELKWLVESKYGYTEYRYAYPSREAAIKGVEDFVALVNRHLRVCV